MTLTISLSLNATLTNGPRYATVSLPLLWLAAPLDKWRRRVRSTTKLATRIKTGLALAAIVGRALAWGLL